MSDFLTITERYLKENSIINDNTDMKIITPTIILVQDKYLEPILGTPLFKEVKDQIQNNTLTSLNQTLLDDYILKAMIWYTLHESTPAFKYRYMNKGVMVKNSDNSSAADLDEIKFLMDKWRKNAEYYSERITMYLKANMNLYPLYYTYQNYNDKRPNRTNYTTSLFLDTRNGMSEWEEYMQRIGNY